MASPFQRQALQRKLIYAALILVLLTVTWGWRYANFNALGVEVKGVDKQAQELAIREQSRGEVDLTGAVVRLSLTGMRGWATCACGSAPWTPRRRTSGTSWKCSSAR